MAREKTGSNLHQPLSRRRVGTETFLALVEVVLVLAAGGLLLALVRHLATTGPVVMGDDIAYYRAVAQKIVAGQLPYRDFPFEYPVLALVPLVLAGVASSFEAYAWALAGLNALFLAVSAALLWFIARSGYSSRSPIRTAGVFLLLVAATPVVLFRLDALASLLTLAAFAALIARRNALSGVALALSALVKLYAVVLVPLFAWREFAAGRRRAAVLVLVASLASAVVVSATLFALSGASGLEFIGYQTNRGVQVESVVGSLVLLGHALAGVPVQLSVDYFSWQVASPLVDALGWTFVVLPVAMGALLAVSAYSSFRWSSPGMDAQLFVELISAALLLFMLAYRVLSPQYLAWLLPFAALLTRGKLALVLAACVLTSYIFPLAYQELLALDPGLIIALAMRNILLLGLFAWLVAPGLRICLGRAIRPGRTHLSPVVQ